MCLSRHCYSLISSLPVLSFLGRGSALAEAAAEVVLGECRGAFARLKADPGISDVLMWLFPPTVLRELGPGVPQSWCKAS